MKRIIAIIILSALMLSFTTVAFAGGFDDESVTTDLPGDGLTVEAESVCLMEASTGKILTASNEYSAASPASVTKIMTLLLVCEALAEGVYKLEDTVTVSDYAASMGGSQVFLEEGEGFTVEELLKCTVIASANDAAVALAEYTAGSEEAFVRRMNERAAELGLKNTSFENTTGLDDTVTNHYSCAADIAVMSRELIAHDIILKYSSIWQDSIRDGEFTLTNTNRLVRFYDGCNGLKTGSTDKAGYCVSATAKRGNMQLIAVVMGAKTRDKRNEAARKLLDYGFANYALYERPEQFIENVPVIGGKTDYIPLRSPSFSAIVKKSDLSKIEIEYEIPESIKAPITEGDEIGKIVYRLGEEILGEDALPAGENIEKISLFELMLRILRQIVGA